MSITSYLIAQSMAAGTADVTINTNLPGGVVDPASGVAEMVAQAYQYLVSIAGGIAFLVIVYAGIQWALSQGNAGKISDAKDRIWQALYGILILFGAYLLLSMVNPSLTYLQMPTLQPIQLPDEAYLYSPDTGPSGFSGEVTGTEDYDRTRLKAAGVHVNADPPRTELAGVRKGVIDYVIAFKEQCNCDVTITAGSEKDSHSTDGNFTHVNGYKVDLQPNPGIDAYVQSHFTKGTVRKDGAQQWINNGTGAVWARESNHWDIVVK
jgi:hypothetical protein